MIVPVAFENNGMREVHYSDMADRFVSEIDKDELIYTVSDHGNFTLTSISPGKIGDELYRTKGHVHVNGEYEMYRGIEGMGKIVQILPDGTVLENKLWPDDRVEIEPYAYHYAVNTGDTAFKFVTLFANNVEKDYTMKG